MSPMNPEDSATTEDDTETVEVVFDPETAPPGGRGIDGDGRCTMCGILVEDCECPLDDDGEACEFNGDFCGECDNFIADCTCLTCAKCHDPIAAGTQVAGPNGDLHEECFDPNDDGMDDEDESSCGQCGGPLASDEGRLGSAGYVHFDGC